MTTALLGLTSALAVACSSATPPAATGSGASSAPSRTTAAAAPAATPTTSSQPAPAVVRTTRAVPHVVRNGCVHNTAARAVRVSLREQHLWMCAGPRLVRDTPITSGVVGQYTSTPTGHYVVQGVQRDTTLTLTSGESFAVKYWIPFDGPLFGFHDSSWQHFPYGSPLYKTRGSHGCVHVPLKAIAFLARWSSAGTTQVLIHA